MRLVLGLLIVVLTGCASTFHKPGQTQQEFDHDSSDCQMKTNLAGKSGWPGQRFYDQCMSGYGWIKD